jgi:hypothetical protein
MGGTLLARLFVAPGVVGELGDASLLKYEALLDVGDRGELSPSPGLEGTGGPVGRGGTARCTVSEGCVSTDSCGACRDISSSDSDPALGDIVIPGGGGGGGRAIHISFSTIKWMKYPYIR